jgi:hypothetical protein
MFSLLSHYDVRARTGLQGGLLCWVMKFSSGDPGVKRMEMYRFVRASHMHL